MTETMGPIYDRTQEHLGTTDAMVIFVRRRLLDAARALRDRGVVPANVDDAHLCRVRPASALLPEGGELGHGHGEGAPVRRRRAHRLGALRLMSAPALEPDAGRALASYEAVPYLLVLESVERDGEWVRRAAPPELPGCVAEAPAVLEAIENLEQERRRMLRHLWDRGAPIPVPRPPLRGV